MPHRTALSITFGAFLAALTPGTFAAPALDYTLGVLLEHSDNINLSDNDPISGNILAPRLAFSLDEQGATLTANAAGSLEYRDYFGAPFGNELRTLLSGSADWHISPGRFDWVFADNIGRQPVNALQSDAPSNQQQTNLFTTGPTLRAKFNDVLRGQFDLRYTNSRADTTSDFNSNRYGAVGSLLYQLDPADTLSGSVTAGRTRYIEAASRQFDYDREDAYVGYQRDMHDFTFNAAVGYSFLDIRNLDSRSGSLLRAGLHWNPSPATTLGVNLDHEYSDAAQDLVFTPNQLANVGIGSGINGAVVTPQVYVGTRASLDFSHHEDRFRVAIAPFWRKLNYIDTTVSDQHSTGYYASAEYSLQPTLWFGFFVGQERRSYTSIDRTDDDLGTGISLNLQRTPHWLYSLSVAHTRRNSDGVNSSYTENSLMLTVTWRR